jgi:NAD(P)-dependent dehydrogenase (short-subunit alcohol dehydrogenase family)
MSRPHAEQIHLVTGATQGIGRAAATALARTGARVIITARDAERGARAVEEIRAASDGGRVELALVDFASFASVRAFLDDVNARTERIDVLINNAGAMYSQRRESVDGHELTFQVNHLGYFMTTLGLVPKLEAAHGARVVCVSSAAHRGGRVVLDDVDGRRGWRGFSAYGTSKLMNLLFVREAARRLSAGIHINAIHPGVIASGFGRNGGGLAAAAFALAAPFLKTPEQGADTAVWLATSADAAEVNGGYFIKRKRAAPSAAANDDKVARALWELSERLTGMTLKAQGAAQAA